MTLLDLSQKCVEPLKRLRALQSFNLTGNPCSKREYLQ
jgi:hypothetical protein